MAERILEDDQEALIINLGRSTHEQVVKALETDSADPAREFRQLHSGNRIDFRQVDFTDEANLDLELDNVIQFIRENSLEIAGIIHCAGMAVVHNPAHPEPEKAKDLALMRKVNTDAGVEMGRKLKESGLLAPHARFGYVASLAAVEGKPTVPGLEEYGESKVAAEQVLRELYGEDYFTIYPGIYKTGMVDGFIKDLKTALEFFGIAAGNAVPDDPLMVETSKVIRGEKAVHDVIYPVIPRWYVKISTPGLRNLLLPYFVKTFGRGLLRQIGQGETEHNARLKYHQDHQTYGPDFPYDKLGFNKLYPEALGNMAARVLQFLKLL